MDERIMLGSEEGDIRHSADVSLEAIFAGGKDIGDNDVDPLDAMLTEPRRTHKNKKLDAIAKSMAELSDEERDVVTMLWKCGGNVRETARRLNRPHMTVSDIIGRVRNKLYFLIGNRTNLP